MFLISVLTLFLLSPNVSAHSDDEVARLAAIGRAWGFLKYHHPTVMSGDLDWDDVLLRAIRAASHDDADREDLLVQLLDEAGLDFDPGESLEESPRFMRNADWSWVDPDTLGDDVVEVIEGLRDGSRPGTENHWIGTVEGVGNTTYQNEKRYDDEAYPSPEMRLLGLFRYWNIIQYFFPYRYLIEGDWNDALEEFIPKFRDAPDAVSYHLAALELTTRVEDKHASANSPVLSEYFGRATLPFRLTWVEEKSVVTEVSPGQTTVRVGDVLLEIDGEPIETVRERYRIYAGASNPPGTMDRIHSYVRRGKVGKTSLRLERDGDELEVSVQRSMGAPSAPAGPSWKVIDGQFGYVDMSVFQGDEIEAMFADLRSTKGLIFDMRAYPEFILYELLPLLSEQRAPFVRFTTPDLSRPGTYFETPPLFIGPENHNPDAYAGNIVVIVDHTTISRAEFFAMALQTAGNAIVLGGQTAGADGNVSSFTFPGGLDTMITGIGVYYPDGAETQKVGIPRDIEVHPTIEGLREGRDELLARALSHLSQGT